VPETELARIGPGLPVRARSAAYPDKLFAGNVLSIDTRVDPVTRAITVRAGIPNPQGELRPGMFLTVELVREDVMALMIPEQSIVPEQSQQFVLVVGKGGTVEKRAVRTGRRRPGQVEVVDGLAEGEVVVAEGTQKARPGAAVEVVGKVEVKP
jgi:membrane fusion protein (multidrug efflux system)